jgi:predicted metal-dependent HD superfamily phosphohydrolase
VLESFSRRARIYQTEPMFRECEAQARANLRDEIASLAF